MTKLEDSIGSAAQAYSLTPAEKAAGRQALSAAIAFQENSADLGSFRLSSSEFADGRAVLQDAILAGTHYSTPVLSRIQSFLRLPAIAMGLVLSTGFAVAANNTLPGDALYPVKISVLEPIIGALQPTSDLRAAWSVEVLHRRLWEVDELSTRPSNADVEARFEAAEKQIRVQTQTVLDVTGTLPDPAAGEIRLKAQQAIHQRTQNLRRLLDAEVPAGGENALPPSSSRRNLLTTLEVNEQTLLNVPEKKERDEKKNEDFKVQIDRQPIPGPKLDRDEGSTHSDSVQVTVPGAVKITITAEEMSSSSIAAPSSSSHSSTINVEATGSIQIETDLPKIDIPSL